MSTTALVDVRSGPVAVERLEEPRTMLPAVPVDPAMAFLQTIQQRVQLATMLVASGLIPQKTPEQAMAVMLAGYELGIPPMAAFQNIHPIPQQGGGLRLAKSADLAAATAQQRYGVRIKDIVQWDENACELVFSRPGFADVRSRFTWEDAERAGLAAKNNWRQWPKAMLMARAKMQGVRVICPEVGAGFYDADELGAVTDEHGVPVDVSWEYVPPPPAPRVASSPEQAQPRPRAEHSRESNLGDARVPVCPDCNGEMWDNRAQNDQYMRENRGAKKPKRPDWKCKNSGCRGCFWRGQWPPKDTQDGKGVASPDVLRTLVHEVAELDTEAGERALEYVEELLRADPVDLAKLTQTAGQLRTRISKLRDADDAARQAAGGESTAEARFGKMFAD